MRGIQDENTFLNKRNYMHTSRAKIIIVSRSQHKANVNELCRFVFQDFPSFYVSTGGSKVTRLGGR